MQPARNRRRIIAIAGGGIGGLTAALALQSKGFKVLVLEKTEEPATQGAGIQISPNALRVIDQLGAGRMVRQVASVPDAIKIRHAFNGKLLTQFELGETYRKRHGLPYLVLHRADLLLALLNQCANRGDIEIRNGCEVFDVAQHANGVTILVETQGKMEEVQAAALIGADGVWSRLRQSVSGSIDPNPTGKIAWRALIPMGRVPVDIDQRSTGLWLAPNMHVVHYPLRNASYLNVVCIAKQNARIQPRGWQKQGKLPLATSDFEPLTEPLSKLLNSAEKWGGWPIHETPKIGALNDGLLCLLGDSAHAVAPYAAQGGASAMEDAAVLAHYLTPENSISDGFAAYAKSRRKRLQQIRRLALNNGRLYHLAPPYSYARGLAMKFAPQDAMQKRMDWLYGWEPPK